MATYLGFSATTDNTKVSGIELLREMPVTTTTTAKPTTTTTAVVLTQPVATGTKPSGVTGTWKLKFNDEFVAAKLNTNVWTTCSWVLESGCRPSGNDGLALNTPANVTASSGTVNLTAKLQKATSTIGNQTYDYTTGAIATGPSDEHPNGIYSFKYGYAEARIKTAAGAGMWSAFWLDPQNLTWPPEIDVSEQLGKDPTHSWANLHWGTPANHLQSGQWIASTNYNTSYHVFGMDWEPTYVTWYVDGKAVRTMTSAQATIPNLAMFPVINLMPGGWGGPVNNAALPATMSVDYIRIWQK